MKIAVRMDDIAPGMDWVKFGRFKALLDEYKIKPLIGVVPDNQDENLKRTHEGGTSCDNPVPEDFWGYIKKLQDDGWVIAMHGYQHVYTRKKGGLFPLNHFSEFAGLDYDRQFDMLVRGREIMESHGIGTDIFMPPAHSYDKNTLKALRKAGFCKITDGFGKEPYFWNEMCFYPISFRLDSDLKKKKGMTTMVVHTNTVSGKDMEKYRRIFKENDIMPYGEYLKMKAVKRGLCGRGAEYLSACVKHLLVKLL